MRLMKGRNHAAFLLKERVMTKSRKVRLVRIGDAKVLTKGDIDVGAELGTMRKELP